MLLALLTIAAGSVAMIVLALIFDRTHGGQEQSRVQDGQQADVIAIKLGDNYYAIPVDVLASSPAGQREGAFFADESVLLHFNWPTMSGRTGKSSSADSGNRVQVLMYSVRGGSDPQLALISRFAGQVIARTTSHAVVCTDPLEPQSCPDLYRNSKLRQLSGTDGALRFERYDLPSGDSNFMSDISIEKLGTAVNAFSVCSRPSSKRPGAICSLHFVDHSNWFEAIFDYDRIPKENTQALRDAILHQVREFERAGHQVKNSVDGG